MGCLQTDPEKHMEGEGQGPSGSPVLSVKAQIAFAAPAPGPWRVVLSEMETLLCELTGGGGFLEACFGSGAQPCWLLLAFGFRWSLLVLWLLVFLATYALIVPCFIHFLVYLSFSSACVSKSHCLRWRDGPVVGACRMCTDQSLVASTHIRGLTTV